MLHAPGKIPVPTLCSRCVDFATSDTVAKTIFSRRYRWEGELRCGSYAWKPLFGTNDFDSKLGGAAPALSRRKKTLHAFAFGRNNAMISTVRECVLKGFPLHQVEQIRVSCGHFKGLSAPQLQQRRHFGVGGSYGYNAFFRGAAEVNAQSNVRLQNLPKETEGDVGTPRVLRVIKMPEAVALLRADGRFRRWALHFLVIIINLAFVSVYVR